MLVLKIFYLNLQDKVKISKNNKEENNQPRHKPLIEEIHSSSEPIDDIELSPLQKALEEICDPLLPVRGHGLISLCKLIEKNDKDAMSKQEAILKIFEENLNHPDSYLYLTSVRGLAMMADKYPDLIIPKLAKEFSNFDSKERKIELRMKIGESLVQSTRKLGNFMVIL